MIQPYTRLRAADNSGSQRLLRLNHADTALQAPANVQRHENSAAFCKYPIARNLIRKLSVRNGFDNRISRELQRGSTLRFREGRHPETSYAPRACAIAGVA